MKTAVPTAKRFIVPFTFTDFKEVTKAGLTISVVFYSIAGYLLGMDQFYWGSQFLLIF